MGDGKTSENKMNRRELLGTALTGAAVLVGYSCFGLKDAMAAAKKSGKPLFSPEALNALFPAQPNADYKRLLTEAQSDPQAFVRNHFTLTSDQEKSLAALTPADVSSLKLGIGTALREELRIQSDCGASAKLGPGAQMVAQGSSFQISKAPNQEVVIHTGTTSRKRVTTSVGSAAEKGVGVEGASTAGGVVGFQGTLNLNMMPRSASE
jgi:hypothetical protein